MRYPRLTVKGFTREREREIRALWAASRHLAPSWALYVLLASSDPDNGDGAEAADCCCLPEYGRIAIRFFPLFWEADGAERAALMRHEILHAQTWRLSEFSRRLLAFAPEAVRDHLGADLSSLEESLVQALAHADGPR